MCPCLEKKWSFLVLLLLHFIFLGASYLNLQTKIKNFSSNSTVSTESYQVDIVGGFIQKYEATRIRIRCKQLEAIITLRAKQDVALTIEIVNLHPERSIIKYPQWKRLANPSQIQLDVTLKQNETVSIPIHFRYPQPHESFSFIVFGDVEDGYASLLALRQKLRQENPLFLISLGDLVNKGTGLRHQMMQDFLDSIACPLFALPGDGDIDDFPGAKKRHLQERMTLFQKFYGRDQFLLELPKLSLVALNTINTTLDDITQYRLLLNQTRPENQRIVLAHVPPEDPRPLLEREKKRIASGEIVQHYLQLMREERISLGLYGHLHYPFDFFLDQHRVVITGGIGARPFSEPLYDYLHVAFSSQSAPEIQVKVQRIAEIIGIKWLNKYSIYLWGWWYLMTASIEWLLLHLLVFLSLLLKIRFYFRKAKKLPQERHA